MSVKYFHNFMLLSAVIVRTYKCKTQRPQLSRQQEKNKPLISVWMLCFAGFLSFFNSFCCHTYSNMLFCSIVLRLRVCVCEPFKHCTTITLNCFCTRKHPPIGPSNQSVRSKILPTLLPSLLHSSYCRIGLCWLCTCLFIRGFSHTFQPLNCSHA